MQKYLFLAIFLVTSSLMIASRAENSASTVDAQLSQLEDRYFEHPYNSDADTDRLNRIEEFIYGSSQTGSMQDRLKRIMSTVPSDESSTSTAASQTAPSKNVPSNTGSSNTAATAQPSSTTHKSTFDYGSYPRVTNLEQELLGRTYPNDSLTDRLARLETKAYGAPSTETDLCQRVDLLDDYAQRHDLFGQHKTIASAPMTFNSTSVVHDGDDDAPSTPINKTQNPWANKQLGAQPSSYTGSTGSFVGSAEETVSMMEAQEFGHTYTDKSLDVRLKKLEKKILPTQDISNLSLQAQTVKLWVTLHPTEQTQIATLADDNVPSSNPIANSSTNTQPTSSATKPKSSWLHKLATAGGGLMQTGQGPNSNSAAPTTYGTNSPYYGMGIPGSGLGTNGGRYYGMSVGPGSGPGGIPVGFW